MENYPSILESIKDLNTDQINGLLSRASQFKRNNFSCKDIFPQKKKIIANMFLENSTRTVNSFAVACQKLEQNYLYIDASKTSLSKGESLRETLLTLHHQGIDLVIIRTPEAHHFKQFKNENFPMAIINAGDGMHQHPTQALLDLFTMLETGMELLNKTILIAGDCEHSRVARSLIDLLPQFGVKIILAGPEAWTKSFSSMDNIECMQDMDQAIKKSDLIYLLRIQNERHNPNENLNLNLKSDYHSRYGVNLERLKRLNKLIPVYHPGPFNVDVEISMDIVNSQYYFGYKQVENSVYMRMAIIEKILTDKEKSNV